MKLFYGPGACSIGIHVILEELGLPFETQRVSTRDGSNRKPDYLAINPKAKVPALMRDDGSVLTEFPVIAWWLAKSHPGAGLIPPDFEGEARTLEWLDYLCGTVHPQGFTRQFRPENFAKDEADKLRVVAQGVALAQGYLELVEGRIAGDPWLLASGYSVADAALFFLANWAAGRAGMTLPPKVARHLEAMKARPAVQRVIAREAA
ncbi:glutathione S-transferase [Roseococcus sp. SYP-B2431]|uniref:glutathione S-transferase family protein n=1 Tax=Roseococcus sp. SYP-B2431 TaxID=2496640 RepID=UPI001038E551|nr:glutathione S-transferase N-terminal domain-containing protein [Roseococcus sp. SYP-B2431]TCH99889.1 glutathione S-transferase [Roseococcus sp. SYP-B2431]